MYKYSQDYNPHPIILFDHTPGLWNLENSRLRILRYTATKDMRKKRGILNEANNNQLLSKSERVSLAEKIKNISHQNFLNTIHLRLMDSKELENLEKQIEAAYAKAYSENQR